jgi:hypothetical protein
MIEVAIILPLVAFLVLAVMFLLFLRRAGRLGAATRDVDRFRRQVSDLASRAEVSLAQMSVRIDALRRGSVAASALTDDLTASLDAAERYAEEGRSLRPPNDGYLIRDALVSELERARRALEMVEHGCTIQSTMRAGSRGVEAQTAIKRGYLNLLHAREAIARHAQEAAALVPADQSRRPPFRRTV